MQIELNTEEAELIGRILKQAHADLRVETRRTETHRYHDQLQKEQHLMEGILAKLTGSGQKA